MNRPSEFVRRLRERFSVAGSLLVEQAECLERHFEVLGRWNKVINLTSIRSREEAIVRHSVTLGQALRIPGVTPAAIAVLDVYLSLSSRPEPV